MSRSMNAGVLVVGLALAACGGGSDDAIAGPTTKLTLLPTTTTIEPSAATTVATLVDSTTTAATAATLPSTTPTTTAPAAATTTTEPVDPAVESLILGDDGIGAAVFSGDPDGVVSFISTFVGPPTTDTGWVDPFTISFCPGTELRVVSWGGLVLSFGDVSPVLEGRRHFFSYTYGLYTFDGVTATATDQTPAGLVTSNGIGLGTNLVELEAAHPGLILNPADEFFPETFVINDNLRGALNGLADDSTIVSLAGGQDCVDPT